MGTTWLLVVQLLKTWSNMSIPGDTHIFNEMSPSLFFTCECAAQHIHLGTYVVSFIRITNLDTKRQSFATNCYVVKVVNQHGKKRN